jgi:hypothetical protein
MLKSIKKSYNIFIGVLAVLVLTITILFLIVRLSFVQTFIIEKVSGYISDESNSTVSIGKVRFTFFNKLELKEVLIKDQHNDTLFYTPDLTAGIRQLSLKHNTIKLGKVVVIKPVIALVTDSTGLMNLNWFLNMFQKPKDSTSVSKSLFHINQIEISDARFSLINKAGPVSKTPIDLNNIKLQDINCILENIDVRDDSVSLDIYNLGFRELNGFVVKKMSSNLAIVKQKIHFRDLSLLCDSSIINARHIDILADSAASFKRFEKEVKLDISLQKSLINSNELKHFLAFLKDYNESFWLSGDVSGTISELKGRHINLTYKNETSLDCNFDFSGLPDIQKTFIFIDVIDFRSISKDIEQINIPGKGKILLPEVLRKLGVVSFSGSFTGFTTDFVTYGKINTNKGIISTDVSLRPNGKDSYLVKGLIRGIGIDLGSITENYKLFGGLSMEANIDGTATSFEKFAVNVTGKIDSVEINYYKYRNVSLSGLFTEKAWDGNIKVEDKNIQMELLGMFDFSRKLPEFDFTMNLRKADLYNLNLDKSDTSASITMLLTANFTGNSIDNLDGEIKLLNSEFIKYSNKLDIYDFTIKTFKLNNLPSISLRTDFLDANLYGRYNFAGIGNSIKTKLAELMPSKFQKPKTDGKPNINNFIFDIKFKNTTELNTFLKTGISLSENSLINGSFFPDSIISVSASSTSFSVNNNTFKDLSVAGNISDTISKVIIKSSTLNISGISELKDLKLTFESSPDKFLFDIDWDNKEKILNKGKFVAEGTIDRVSPEQKKPVLKIALLPADIFVRDTLWKIYPSVIVIDSNYVSIKELSIRNKENYFLIDGVISENKADTMNLEFNGIDIGPLNNLYEKQLMNDPNMIKLSLGGKLNGKVSFTDLYKNFMFESDISLNDFTILGSRYGNVKIVSIWNFSKKVADITASNNYNGKKMFDISGYYDPRASYADLIAIADSLPIDLLNPLLKTFASGITGTASGKLNFTGNFKQPVLTGALMGEKASMKIDYLQTRYTFNDTIRFDKAGIKFNNIRARDDKGNIGTLNGAVFHKYFKNFIVDLSIRANDLMVLNTKPKDSDLFYGTAYASGLTTIKTNGPVLSFDISAKTAKNTRFSIPLNTNSSVTDKSFIMFVDTKQEKRGIFTPVKTPSSTSAQSSMEINFDLEVTPDAEVQLIFDSKEGDVMKGTGTASLNVNLNRKGEFKMYGDYFIEDGEYLFTLGSIFNKKFVVQNGGKISFNGNVEDADIDIKAIYRTKASLNEIMPGLLDEAKLKEKIPVECWLYLTGNLFNPAVSFDINLPTADEETKAYLRSMIKSDEEMSRQILFLLAMNSFYADPSLAGTSQSTADIGSATVGVTTMEMVSNQLSNMLSQISNNVDIGVVYRPGSTAMPNSQEVQFALSTQILNDKVTINGNFDYGVNQAGTGSTTQSNNALTGAFDVEFRITEKIRFKVFNRSNDNFYTNNGIQYTQGVGLFFKQDFDRFKDLFKKPVKSPLKKEEVVRIKNK